MNTKVLLLALLAVSAAQAADAPPASFLPLPPQFSLMGNGGPLAYPGHCNTGIDRDKSTDGSEAYSVHCDSDQVPGFSGARYSLRSEVYRGKRIRVSAQLMTAGADDMSTPQYPAVSSEAGLWISVGSQRNGTRSDRMQNRALKGTTGWESRDFVVDVPADSNQIFIGYWLQGRGQVWVRDFKIEEVPDTVAVNFLVTDPTRNFGPDLSLAASTDAAGEFGFQPPPAKWLAIGGQGFELCDIGVDSNMLKAGQRNLSISCSIPHTPALRQSVEAAPFWGKRVRFSGWVKSQDFEPLPTATGQGGAGLWMSNSNNDSGVVHANVTGTTDWTYRELVIDVPRTGAWILMGLGMSGSGQVWARDLKFEEVPMSTPVTPPGPSL